MKIIFDSQEFSERTQLVGDHLDFFGIEPDTRLGHFFPNRLDELLRYCEQYPEFHIVSELKNGAGKINRPIENAVFYLLAEGDADPNLICRRIRGREQLETLQICEYFVRS